MVYARGFLGEVHGANEFRFMSTEVSRERPVNYEELAARVGEEKRRGGYLVWVVGPALVHSRARADFEWFIRNGYVQAVLAGNAVAVHDIEAAIFGTTLGMSNTGQPTEGGHGLHMRAINRVRAAGSIERAVETGLIKSGIMHALVTSRVPYVLAGSIRDDGPLPGVYSDNLEAQDAMREHTVKATGAIFVATALHAIAVGNMLPAFYLCDGAPGAAHDHLRGPDRVRRQQTQGPGDPPGVRRGHQRAGFHARAAVLYRTLGARGNVTESVRGAAIVGSGWDRLAQAVADVLPPPEVDGVWVFTPLRHEAGSGAPPCSPG